MGKFKINDRVQSSTTFNFGIVVGGPEITATNKILFCVQFDDFNGTQWVWADTLDIILE